MSRRRKQSESFIYPLHAWKLIRLIADTWLPILTSTTRSITLNRSPRHPVRKAKALHTCLARMVCRVVRSAASTITPNTIPRACLRLVKHTKNGVGLLFFDWKHAGLSCVFSCYARRRGGICPNAFWRRRRQRRRRQ